MRKMISAGLLIVLTGASVAFAASHSVVIGGPGIPVADMGCHVIGLSELTYDRIEDFFAGKAPHVVLECTQGSILPFNISLASEFLALDGAEAPHTIKVLKTCFIKCVEGTFYFSADLQSWKDFQGFFTGMIGVSLNVNDSSPEVGLNIELNQRT